MRITRDIPLLALRPLALTIGNFDGVHIGHRAMLAELSNASRRLGVPSCVMLFEPQPREFFAPDKAPARLTPLRDKLELLADCGVDQVQICRFDYHFAQMAPTEFIERILVSGLGVRWLQVGDDFRFGARRAGDFAMLQKSSVSMGFEVHSLPSVRVDEVRVSSTAVREALANGQLPWASQLLGHPFNICGRVIKGDQLGRTLGYPTANVRIKHNRLPLSGIFAVQVHGVGSRVVRGVASLGVRPTVKVKGEALLEVYLFEFDQDIYGRHLKVDFLHKLRDEEKYSDLETLRLQIGRDVQNTRDFFVLRDKDLNAQS